MVGKDGREPVGLLGRYEEVPARRLRLRAWARGAICCAAGAWEKDALGEVQLCTASVGRQSNIRLFLRWSCLFVCGHLQTVDSGP